MQIQIPSMVITSVRHPDTNGKHSSSARTALSETRCLMFSPPNFSDCIGLTTKTNPSLKAQRKLRSQFFLRDYISPRMLLFIARMQVTKFADCEQDPEKSLYLKCAITRQKKSINIYHWARCLFISVRRFATHDFSAVGDNKYAASQTYGGRRAASRNTCELLFVLLKLSKVPSS